MRVAWVLYESLSLRTGGTIYDARVVEGLRRAGDDVRVVSLDEDPHSEGSEIRARRGLERTLPPIARAGAIAKAGLALARRIQEMDPEVARSHIALYVNEFTRDLGTDGFAAVEALLER